MIKGALKLGSGSAFCFSMRKILCLFLFIFLVSCSSDEELKIGVAVYDFEDSFITEVRNSIVECSSDDIPVTVLDAAGRQQTQNEQIERFIDEGYSAIIVNSVDRTASGVLIEKCRQNDVPLVFFNREPVKDDMAKWDKVYYVGARAEDSGIMAGEIMADYWYRYPEADKNHDGILQFVVIRGETGHQDTELRTEYFIDTLFSEGIALDKLHEDTGSWTREGGYSVMSSFLSHSGDRIEAVFANNDDMAIAAAKAARDSGNQAYANTIFLGFNGDRAACEAILADELTMSIAQMAYEMGYKSVEAMVQTLDGEQVEPNIDSGSEVITIDNAQERLDTLDEQLGS